MVFEDAADKQVGVVTLAVVAAAATSADADFHLAAAAAAVDTHVEILLVLHKHLPDSTYGEPRLSAAGQRHRQASEAASSGGH